VSFFERFFLGFWLWRTAPGAAGLDGGLDPAVRLVEQSYLRCVPVTKLALAESRERLPAYGVTAHTNHVPVQYSKTPT
jgi:hypothetical protein